MWQRSQVSRGWGGSRRVSLSKIGGHSPKMLENSWRGLKDTNKL